jgi:hypothetical protein
MAKTIARAAEQTTTAPQTGIDVKDTVDRVLSTIDREREREVISRRYGLYGRRETLEQIGELLGITRERVRQLEKGILIRLKLAAEENTLDLSDIEKQLIRHLHELGRVARVSDLTDKIASANGPEAKSRIAFIAELSPNLSLIEENDDYHQAVGIREHGDEKRIRELVTGIVKTIKETGEPLSIEQLHEKLDLQHPDHVRALASLSKQLASLRDSWGLVKWPTVNPKNIRDKIYVILAENGAPMHFSDIAGAIKDSDFKRKNVTTQAIHNELIKDKRFVLIGRGIYALDEWGYQKGTVSDIITEILKKNGEPMHRDDIVKAVLKKRHVKETTILLNLQSKPQFKRVKKATYALAE